MGAIEITPYKLTPVKKKTEEKKDIEKSIVEVRCFKCGTFIGYEAGAGVGLKPDCGCRVGVDLAKGKDKHVECIIKLDTEKNDMSEERDLIETGEALTEATKTLDKLMSLISKLSARVNDLEAENVELKSVRRLGLTTIYFVLKPGGNSSHAKASRDAIYQYAKSIEKSNPTLAVDLRKWVAEEYAKANFNEEAEAGMKYAEELRRLDPAGINIEDGENPYMPEEYAKKWTLLDRARATAERMADEQIREKEQKKCQNIDSDSE